VFATVEATERYAAWREAAPAWAVVDDRAIASLSDSVTPAGVVAVCRFLDVPWSSVVEVRAQRASKPPSLVAICADVRDPGNAGTVIRTADAAGADGDGETSLDEAGDLLGRRTAWLFGNEAWGLPPEVAALADHRIRIPIHGRAESLNLSTAAALCLYASASAHRSR
jgi:TrmH family RNA methyltransferase